jgi:hypothetical protein
MVFQVVEVKSLQKIWETLLPFLELIEEFLSVRPGLSGCSCADMFLDFLPLLAMNFEGLKKPKMLVLGPSPCLMRHRTQFHVRWGHVVLHLWGELLLLQGISEVLAQLLLDLVFFKYLGGGLYFS